MGNNGIPIITEKVVSYIECNILQVIDCGTHDLFLLEMQEGEKIEEKEPMTYHYYHTVIKGKTPPKASSYNED